MQAIVLLGGKGTRLSALYPDRPKALVPIAGKPFLEWQLEWLVRGGVTEFHLAAGHLAGQIEAWAAAQRAFRITVSREPQALGTGGGLKYVESFLASDPFYVVNGDSLMPNLDFQSLEKFHRDFPMIGKNGAADSRARTTIAVSRIESAGRYGTVEFDAHGTITAFREKAGRDAGWINGGVYLMGRKTLKDIPAGTNISIETGIFPVLVTEGRVAAFRGRPPMLDMGTPDGIRAMEEFLRKAASR